MENHPISLAPARGMPTESPDGKTFIGGKSKEFQKHVGEKGPSQDKASVSDKEQSEVAQPEKCPTCDAVFPDTPVNFCPSCGAEMMYGDPAKVLGITLTEEDLGEYLFQGYLVRDLSLIGEKKATFKTLVVNETNELEKKLDELLANEKDMSMQRYNNYRALHQLSYAWLKIDGTSLGSTAEERYSRLGTYGGHVIDIATNRLRQFNQAVARILENPKLIKN